MHNSIVGLALVLSPIVGLVTPYLIVVLSITTWLEALFTGKLAACYQDFAARSFLIAFGLLGLAFFITQQTPRDIGATLNFTMFLLYGPLAVLMRRGAVSRRALPRISLLCLIGAGLSFAVVAWSAASGDHRPSGPNIGPIVLSNAALALGFVSVMGAVANTKRANLIFFLGPLFAIGTVLLTKSRGPLIGIPFLLLATFIFLWFGRFRRIRLVAIIAVVVLAVGAGVALVVLGGRSMTLFNVLGEFLSGDRIADHSSRVRLVLYRAGLQAFAHSPFFGHGWAHLMSSLAPYVPENYKSSLSLPQAHNDVLNFAISGGAVGITAYVLIIAAPIGAALRAPRNPHWSIRLYAVTVMAITYVSAGLTDLMFGHEFHSALYVTMTAIILGIGWSDRPGVAAVEA